MSEDFGYTIYQKVAADSSRNVIFYFWFAGVIWFVSHFWLAAAKILFWLTAIIVVWSVAHSLMLLTVGIVGFLQGKIRSCWLLLAANGVRLVENALCIVALWLAAKVVGYLP